MGKVHNYIGWREAERWKCIRCGKCCEKYIVPLKFSEALTLTRKYGPVALNVNGKYYLTKKADGSCIFLNRKGPIAYCSIYLERPICCKLYPFHITRRPLKVGNPKSAELKWRGENVYLYVDSTCPGTGSGYPIRSLASKIIQLWGRYKSIP
ncbi:MAG: YkgJ family cysteine cluster protein [Candidatus Methanomethylicota archaeon]|nr:MAG: YkgJ family cysteine cluster protein [Candidatus Verstraetearchaeota archaeon]